MAIRLSRGLGFVILVAALAATGSPSQSQDRIALRSADPSSPSTPMDTTGLALLSALAEQEISSGHLPGAVIIAGYKSQMVYLRAFGHRMLVPRPETMTTDTIFDLASLTKVVATAPAILRLVDEKRLDLDAPVARYWQEFAQNGKETITVRDLLTHFSGLRVGIDPRVRWVGERGALAAIAADRPLARRGIRFSYSDVDFLVLGELVRRVSGLSLNEYCARTLFQPLQMNDTGFRPGAEKRSRIAPSDEPVNGLPQDPIARRMGGVAGHAGLFSTAQDLARFAQMMANGGELDGVRVLSTQAVRLMTSVQSPPGQDILRGLGWDIRSPFSTDHSASFPDGSFGHTGYTGTSIWIDPTSKSYLIILSNRLHPNGRGQVRTLRAGAAALFARSMALPPPGQAQHAVVPASVTADVSMIEHGQADPPGPTEGSLRTGIDVLAEANFAPLVGRRVGLLTNQTGCDSLGRRTADLLARAPGVTLVSLFSPEHGLEGSREQAMGDGIDGATGLPVHSLYGEVKKPTPEMLRGIDVVVIDLQDVGARFFTYATTLAYVLEASAQARIKVYVLDRPNPIKASIVQGPVMDADLKSFTGYYPLPTRHGMTMGELARLFNGVAHIGADLHIVAMRGYARDEWYDATDQTWVSPSPNLRSLQEAILYPGVAMIEGANVSVGRGTSTPFELVGAPWIDGPGLAAALNRRAIPGVRFEAAEFIPTSGVFQSRRCLGVRIEIVDRDALDSPRLGLELVSALQHLHPGQFQIDRTVGMVGSRAVLQALKGGDDPRDIARAYKPALDSFKRLRASYLIY